MLTIKEFSATIGDVISFVDNPIIIVGSLTLLKGLFFQLTEGKVFIQLVGVELTFIVIVTLYLLYSSLLELWNYSCRNLLERFSFKKIRLMQQKLKTK